MKTKVLKIGAVIALTLLLILSLALTAGAEAQDVSPDEAPLEEAVTETDGTVGEAEDAGASFMTRLGTEFKSYLGEIFSALTLVGSVVLAIAYKRGLLPVVKGALNATAGAVTKIRESTEKCGEDTRALSEAVSARLENAESTLSSLADRIDELNRQLEEKAESATERERMHTVMLAQVDMLYQVFMSSSLPQYEKDSIAERVGAMKQALSEGRK